MNEKSFSTMEALRFGWDTLSANVVFFLKLLIALIALSIIPGIVIAKIAVLVGPVLGLPLNFLNLIWQTMLGMGVLKICLELYDRQAPQISDLWSMLPRVLNYLAVKFLFGLIVAVGLILLIVPGMIWMVQFYMGSYLIVDKGKGPIQALKHSSAITNGVKWDLGVFASVIMGVNIVGFICLGVGFLVTLPMTMLASVYVYRKLLEQTHLAV